MLATAKISSVLKKERKIRSIVRIVPLSFCERESDISEYRILTTSWVSAISNSGAPPVMRERPANCPAEVRLVMEISTAAQTGRPAATAITPNVTETDR